MDDAELLGVRVPGSEQFFHFGHSRLGVHAVLVLEVGVSAGVFDELVGPTDARHRRGDVQFVERFQHSRAESAHEHVVFDGADNLGDAAVFVEHLGVERLGEPGVDEGDGETVGFEGSGGVLGEFLSRAVKYDGDIGAVLDDFRLAYRQGGGTFFDGHAFAGAARITDEHRAVKLLSRPKHVHEFVFVFRRHERGTGDATGVGDVEKTVVRRAVVGGETGAVHAENHVEILERDVVDDAVVGALKERGVDGADRVESHGGQTGSEDDGVFFGDADIEVAVRFGFIKFDEAGTAGHGGGDADELGVAVAEFDHRVAENILIVRRRAGFLGWRFSGGDVKWAAPVERLRVFERPLVSFAFLGLDVEQDGLVLLLGPLKRLNKFGQAVAVHRADVPETKFFEQHAGHENAFYRFGNFVFDLGGIRAEALNHALDLFLDLLVTRMGHDPVQIIANGADILRDAPFVIVENDDEPVGGILDVVERFQRHAIGQRRIAEHAHDIFLGAEMIAPGRHAQRRRKRGTGMTGTETIVRAFCPESESHGAAGLADL
jgi:hypothetical protein